MSSAGVPYEELHATSAGDWNSITNKPSYLVDWTADQGDTNINVNNLPILNYAPNTLASNGNPGLSSYNFTEARKNKLSGIADGAEVNVQANWLETDNTSDAFIQNKPDLSNFATTSLASNGNNGLTSNDFTTALKTKLENIVYPDVDINVQANWSETDNTSDAFIQNKPNLSSFITASSTDTLTNKSMSYSQLTGTPTIPTNVSNLTNDSGYITASSTDTLTNKSMSYSQLTGTPTIPTYNAGTGVTINGSNQISIGQSVNVSDSPSFTQMSLGNTGVSQGILNLQDFTNNGTEVVAQIKGTLEGTNGGSLAFYTKIDGGSVTEKLRITDDGAIGIEGANYGTSGQVLTSNGSGSAVSWTTTGNFTVAGSSINAGIYNYINFKEVVNSPSTYTRYDFFRVPRISSVYTVRLMYLTIQTEYNNEAAIYQEHIVNWNDSTGEITGLNVTNHIPAFTVATSGVAPALNSTNAGKVWVWEDNANVYVSFINVTNRSHRMLIHMKLFNVRHENGGDAIIL